MHIQLFMHFDYCVLHCYFMLQDRMARSCCFGSSCLSVCLYGLSAISNLASNSVYSWYRVRTYIPWIKHFQMTSRDILPSCDLDLDSMTPGWPCWGYGISQTCLCHMYFTCLVSFLGSISTSDSTYLTDYTYMIAEVLNTSAFEVRRNKTLSMNFVLGVNDEM